MAASMGPRNESEEYNDVPEWAEVSAAELQWGLGMNPRNTSRDVNLHETKR